ncbi:MAG: hypothetical protein LBG49_02675 [Mycoplasmataceae bacterium]|nr:hypothetical protein [Mycoplasmataceae bacterium]
MKQSKDEISNEFQNFCNHVYQTWEFIFNVIKSKACGPKELEEIYRLEEISNHFEASIQDDCIWAISKNEPMANHLRYIVAIINSIKDLERIADYGVSAVRFFVNNSVSDDIRSIIQSILNDALKAMNKIFHAIHNKTAIDSYKECQKIHADFKEKYNHIINKLSGILKRRSAEQIEKLFQGAIIIIKHIERIIDHCSNITENFMFIKESEFFFNKHSKQI